MTSLATWLDRRAPAPPGELDGRLRETLRKGRAADPALLASTARDVLSRARDRPGRVRASAFDLLEADALLTYACEAALDSDDPAGALREVLRLAITP